MGHELTEVVSGHQGNGIDHRALGDIHVGQDEPRVAPSCEEGDREDASHALDTAVE